MEEPQRQPEHHHNFSPHRQAIEDVWPESATRIPRAVWGHLTELDRVPIFLEAPIDRRNAEIYSGTFLGGEYRMIRAVRDFAADITRAIDLTDHPLLITHKDLSGSSLTVNAQNLRNVLSTAVLLGDIGKAGLVPGGDEGSPSFINAIYTDARIPYNNYQDVLHPYRVAPARRDLFFRAGIDDSEEPERLVAAVIDRDDFRGLPLQVGVAVAIDYLVAQYPHHANTIRQRLTLTPDRLQELRDAAIDPMTTTMGAFWSDVHLQLGSAYLLSQDALANELKINGYVALFHHLSQGFAPPGANDLNVSDQPRWYRLVAFLEAIDKVEANICRSSQIPPGLAIHNMRTMTLALSSIPRGEEGINAALLHEGFRHIWDELPWEGIAQKLLESR